jgi:YVTN family beta-propeller protein
MAITLVRQGDESARLVTGKFVTPAGDQVEVGSSPVNMKLSPDGRFIAVTDCGFREQVSILDAKDGHLVSKREFVGERGDPSGLYYGLAFSQPGGRTHLFVSRGAQDLISDFELSDSGVLSLTKEIADPAPKSPSRLPHHVAGLAVSGDGSTVYAVNNQTDAFNGMHGSVSAFGTDGTLRKVYPVGGYPMDVAFAAPTGGGSKLFVSNERDGTVTAIDVNSGKTDTIKTGASPVAMILNRAQTKLYVSNSCGDTVTVLDTATNKAIATILLRIGDLKGLQGATPLGSALSPDESTLYVALADANAVAVVDLNGNRLKGFIPAGWGPTAALVSPDGTHLFVSNAKGVLARTPNNRRVRKWDQYAPNILEGTVSAINLSSANRNLKSLTKTVLANNMAVGGVESHNRRAFVNPGIDHVVYIIKENRTYDQVLGDVSRGNGDPSICLFPKEVTPNQHALAERFVLLDNFYVCAEVSFDGWTWSTQGIANPYIERNVPYNYSGRGRSYDSEGENSGVPVDLRGVHDVTTEPNGFIWDQCARQKVSYRNYGFFLSFRNNLKDPGTGQPLAVYNAPTKRALVGNTDLDFLQFDTSYADSDAWVKYGLKPAPRQQATFGSHKDPSRISSWKREFDEYVKNRSLPRFSMLRLMRDHTAGTGAGQTSPRGMVADNDYAVGEVVDAISHSPYWKSTVICVLEDDAQAGFDHVDCHRSPAYVISPWIEKGKVDSHFYNTDSMLRTMELVLGLKPLSQYDAVAMPIKVFSKSAGNDAPFNAILPSKEVIGEVNRRSAYRSKDSDRLIGRFDEDSDADLELNDILWGSIKGAKTPRPLIHGAR